MGLKKLTTDIWACSKQIYDVLFTGCTSKASLGVVSLMSWVQEKKKKDLLMEGFAG